MFKNLNRLLRLDATKLLEGHWQVAAHHGPRTPGPLILLAQLLAELPGPAARHLAGRLLTLCIGPWGQRKATPSSLAEMPAARDLHGEMVLERGCKGSTFSISLPVA